MSSEPRDPPQFYLTSPAPCPYLPEREERKVFTHLIGRRAVHLNDALTHSGFRRSQTIAYRPACDHCKACVSVRILCDEFSPNRTQRKVLARNAELDAQFAPARADAEQFALFRAYLDRRHAEGGMADMAMLDYAMMIEDSHVDSRLVTYRAPDGRLVAACLTDLLEDGLSMVYSYYAPDRAEHSLGAYMILEHIARAKSLGLPHLYLGYWVEGSKKMGYKDFYKPQQRLGPEGWTRVD